MKASICNWSGDSLVEIANAVLQALLLRESVPLIEVLEMEFPWFAIQVQPNYEKVTSRLLRQKGLDEFLPVYVVRSRRSDRVKQVEVPLFPGYVFCRCDWQPGVRAVNTPGVLTTPGVVRIVGFGKCPEPIPDAEMEHVRSLVRSGLPLEPCCYFEAGECVKLTAGPLRGAEGIVLKSDASPQLIVSVTLLQRSVRVNIDPAWIQKVSPAMAASN